MLWFSVLVVFAFTSWAKAILGQHDSTLSAVAYYKTQQCNYRFQFICENIVSLTFSMLHQKQYCIARFRLYITFVFIVCYVTCEWHQLCFRAVLALIPLLTSCYNLQTEQCTHILFLYFFTFFHQLLSPCCFPAFRFPLHKQFSVWLTPVVWILSSDWNVLKIERRDLLTTGPQFLYPTADHCHFA